MSIRSCHSSAEKPLFTFCVTQNRIPSPMVACKALGGLPSNTTPPPWPPSPAFPAPATPALQSWDAASMCSGGPWHCQFLALEHMPQIFTRLSHSMVLCLSKIVTPHTYTEPDIVYPRQLLDLHIACFHLTCFVVFVCYTFLCRTET